MKMDFKSHVTIGEYNVDFLVNDEYIIECYGDFWHCNPNKYKPSYFNKSKKKTAQEIWDRDLERRQTFEEMGYKFIHLWEADIKDYPKKVKKKLKQYLRQEHGYRDYDARYVNAPTRHR